MHSIEVRACSLLGQALIQKNVVIPRREKRTEFPLKAKLIAGTRSLHSRSFSTYAKDPLSLAASKVSMSEQAVRKTTATLVWVSLIRLATSMPLELACRCRESQRRHAVE